MTRYLLVLLFTIFLMPELNSQTQGATFSIPDFSMPQNVIAQARTNLAAADKTPATSGAERIRALLELCTAQKAIDPDSAYAQPAMIAAQASTPGITASTRAMLLTLQAKLLSNIYQRRSYTYDQVSAPDYPLPDDVATWSGHQFAIVIDSLINEAYKAAAPAPVPVTDFAPCLDYSTNALGYLPTVADFVLEQGKDYLSSFRYDSRPNIKQSVRALLDKGLAAAQPGSAPYFYWKVASIREYSQWKEANKALEKLYADNAGIEAARYVLLQICNSGDLYEAVEVEDGEEPDNKQYELRDKEIAILEASLRQFPDWPQNNALKNALTRLRQATMNISVNNRVMPGHPFDITVKSSFVHKGELTLYSIPAGTEYMSVKKIKSMGKRLDTHSITCGGIDTTTTVKFTVAKPGTYAIVSSITAPDSDDTSVTIINADAIDAINLGINGQNATIAVDFNSGAPLRGVKVNLKKKSYRRNGKSTEKNLGQTNRDGILQFTAPAAEAGYTNYLSYKYKGYTYDFDASIRTQQAVKRDNTRQQAFIFTDRPLYHPGDSICWAVALGKDSDGTSEAMGNVPLTVSIFDANGQKAGSAEVTSDATGRANGVFATKKDVLTGDWSIRVSMDGKRLAQSYVMVSDFKLPTFHAEVTGIERNIPSEGCVRISGKATTFSGMPVIGATVDARIFEAARWFRFSPSKELGTLSTTTDASGCFSIDVPAAMLAKAENGNNDYYSKFVVTSSDASTAEATKAFTTGKPYTIVNEGVARNLDTSNALTFTPQAYNADNEKTPIAVKWTLKRIQNGETSVAVLSGTGTSGSAISADVSTLPAANYELVTEAVDTTLAGASQPELITLYNIARNELPADAPRLFVPTTSYKLNGNGTASVTVGVNTGELYLYEAIRHGDTLAGLTMHRLSKGFHTLEINVPASVENAAARLLTIADGNLTAVEIALQRPEPQKARFIAESFRDHLTPGAGEHWRLRLVNGNGTGMASAAVVATMYNRALEELQNPSWPGSFGFLRYFNSLSVFHQFSSKAYGYISQNIKYLQEENIQWPEFLYVGDTYGVYYSVRSSNLAAKMSAPAVAEGMVEEEAVAMDSFATAETAGEITVAGEMQDAGTTEQTGKESGFDYRVAEVLQAFWMPSLTTDAEGNIDLNFTVPNANGTWTFHATGWDKDWQSASYAAECIANKPVMAEPNLPRFLRAGDSARLLATIYNNTEEKATADVTIELFNIADGAVISNSRTTLTLDSKGSGLTAIDIEVPTDATAIGYRIKASTGSYADGEQTAIPILASSSTVIESTEFYLNPDDSKPFSLTVKADDKATLTLQYCQNPVWTIVKAMRGISSSSDNTSTCLAGQLFSALAAKGIISDNAAIASAIGQWSKNPDEDALTSMLAKNEELKKLLLDQTPWVQAATNESQRMQTLTQFLDPAVTESNIKASVEALAKLQNADGGFPWAKWSNESSWWCTETVLTTLGIANSLGLLDNADNRLTDMLQPAYDYLQAQATKPNRPATDRSLALINALLPRLKTSNAAAKVIDNTVADIAAKWKADDAAAKAYDILVLKDKEKDTASEIFASLRQFAVARKGMGVCFPSVNDIRAYATIIQAYAAMSAPKAEIDALRQWIIVRAQATDDLGTYNPDYVIAALMFTGSNWTSVPVGQNVSIDGKPLEINRMESATGYFAQQIDATGRKVTVTVMPNGVTPSYGSVISISRRPMAGIKAKAGRDISIDKRVLVERDGNWVETNSFSLGERVRVQLTIKAGRTMEYVSIDDERPATFEPVEQMPGFIYDGGLAFYRENLNASTRLFISYLPKGTYHVTYDMTAAVAGTFMSGIATLQSQYAPELTAHSASASIAVK